MQAEETVEKRRSSKKKPIAALCIAMMLVAALSALGCAPQQQASREPDASGAATEQEAAGAAVLEGTNMKANDFQQRDAGALPDDYNISAKVNAGSRGCDACHEDLQATIKDIAPTVHIMTTGPNFGKTVDWNDCESSHSMHDTRGGVYLGDYMHATHFSSATFTDADNGNCWSCHATKKNGEIVMWDEYCYEEQLSGYTANTPASEAFFHMRGYDADTSIGISTLASDEVDLKVDLDQEMTDESQRYEAVNFNIPAWTDAELAAWSIEIKGVKNPATLTLADLEQHFEKQTQQVTQECLVNGVNSSLEDSFEASGYLLSDIIEYCGGVDEGAVTVNGIADADEGWNFCVELDDALKNGAFVATEYYGHELTAMMGAPAVLVQPGFPGGTWVKYLKTIEFGTEPVTAPVRVIAGDDFYDGAEDPHLYGCNSAWFNPATDGQVFKVGEAIDLEGFAWVWNVDGHSTKQVQFSWDYGKTWFNADVAPDADPNNWQRFHATWTPTQPGTYCLKVQAVDGKDWHQKKPASVFVTVEG